MRIKIRSFWYSNKKNGKKGKIKCKKKKSTKLALVN